MLIRNKLILRFTLLVLAIQLCFSLFIYYFNAATREKKFQNRMAGKVELTGRILLKRDNLRRGILSALRRRDLLTHAGEQISIFSPQGRLIYASDDHIDQRGNLAHLRQVQPNHQVAFKYGGRECLGVYYEHQGQGYRIFAAGYDEVGHQQLGKLLLILLVGNIGALALTVVAGWYFAEESLKPIARIVREVRRITASNLGQRVHEGNQKDEIAQLAITFNRMLEGLEQAFDAHKSFVAHASHELRTPLANALGTLETSLSYDTDLAEAKRSMQSSIEELRRIIELTNGLLALAKADETSFKRNPVRLDECLTQAIDYCTAKHTSCAVQLHFGYLPDDVEDPFMVLGNEHLLTTALFNLLDNACKYSGKPVTVQLGYHNRKTLLVTVADQGIGIEPQALQRVFEPLFRAENGRSRPGHGIGLPITQKVVRLHKGELTISSEPGQGTTATVRLPAYVAAAEPKAAH
ncbi:HAMP domain-containing sensor histidine kinase [Hymenobacter latericus]|uniref:HAMP domain-containing sensor histidine kinase n=1 Tax=Hymenobacter sp. YIM 151858-1 TaxID=2987688 RepID=UPI0022279BC3|nr:HAMP domain-containing sensor histidine kinase [Hymenobacter sp. YIM 151858-1]UYZ60962.1 HAMP domain-containing histidine kinase [Hymenobacter sp. YIM 151858-1]